MIKSYAATYEKGRLTWVAEKPEIEDGERVLVVVEARQSRQRRQQEVHQALQEARGAWGTGKSLEEIDREIQTRRAVDWPEEETTPQ